MSTERTKLEDTVPVVRKDASIQLTHLKTVEVNQPPHEMGHESSTQPLKSFDNSEETKVPSASSPDLAWPRLTHGYDCNYRTVHVTCKRSFDARDVHNSILTHMKMMMT